MRTIGFRVKSGHAVAVVLEGSAESPRAVARHLVQLCDPEVAETRQPYHDGFYRTEENASEIARRVKIVKRCAKKSVDALVQGGRSRFSVRIDGAENRDLTPGLHAALVVGSVIDPATVGNPHIRAHAHEGRLFRTVLEEALRSRGIECDVIVEKQLPDRAAADLRRSRAAIARTVATFGKVLGGPWRADEKAAATAAWLALR